MYVGKDFDPSDPPEDEIYSFDFINDLNADEELVSAVFDLSVKTGTDASVASRLSGLATVDTGADGRTTVASQRVVGLLAGVTYLIQCLALTDQDNQRNLWSHIICKAPT